MPLLLDKILGQLASPLGVAAGSGLLALLALALGWRGRATVLMAFSVVWLWGWSMPITSHALLDYVSASYPPRHVDTFPAANAIVLLGGSFDLAPKDRIYPEMNAAGDRVWHAARLYHAGKAPLIIVSGGSAWSNPDVQVPSVAAQALLTAFGVPESAIVLEERSRTTRENATHTAAVVTARGVRRLLLVTSAWHMPRAAAVFRRIGLDVIPAPADYALWATTRIINFLPSAKALQRSSSVFREYVGLLVYRLRGWV